MYRNKTAKEMPAYCSNLLPDGKFESLIYEDRVVLFYEGFL